MAGTRSVVRQGVAKAMLRVAWSDEGARLRGRSQRSDKGATDAKLRVAWSSEGVADARLQATWSAWVLGLRRSDRRFGEGVVGVRP
ncbi:hypothetical protein GUJ93_ZPchr0013g34976 [Zizania palustris]|uniref:Uncharacterized protein n=1 Tax=Zizania palustris TaxID=103762 RepID=A0A8J6C267_ZIZPA|nr:hypothetical protein GUJ93_ZPchr0013g34976 [Zizania palustris]